MRANDQNAPIVVDRALIRLIENESGWEAMPVGPYSTYNRKGGDEEPAFDA